MRLTGVYGVFLGHWALTRVVVFPLAVGVAEQGVGTPLGEQLRGAVEANDEAIRLTLIVVEGRQVQVERGPREPLLAT